MSTLWEIWESQRETQRHREQGEAQEVLGEFRAGSTRMGANWLIQAEQASQDNAEVLRQAREAGYTVIGDEVTMISYEELEKRVLANIVSGGGELESDIHRQGAVDMFGVAYEDVTPEQRQIAKHLGFAKHYGFLGGRNG